MTVRFKPEEYFVVVIQMMGAWRPFYRNCRTIQLHTSQGAAESDLKLAANHFGHDRVGIVKMLPGELQDLSNLNLNPAPTNTEEGAQL
jgi:hypothetical protein